MLGIPDPSFKFKFHFPCTQNLFNSFQFKFQVSRLKKKTQKGEKEANFLFSPKILKSFVQEKFEFLFSFDS